MLTLDHDLSWMQSGFAYVHFSTVDALTAALKLDGKPFETRPLRVSRSDGKASLKRSRTDESSKPAARPKGTAAAAAKPHVAQQRAPTASPVASAAAGEASPGKKLKKPRHVPRPGATQPTLPVRSPAESPRPAAAVPKLRANKVPAHYMRLCVLMQVRLTQLLQVKQGALAGIKKKKSQTGKNRDRCVRVLRVARVRVGHSEFAGATRSWWLSLL
jgi:RNA recognition motif-containing protein